ncbi:MAG: trigger factor, partial [Acidobacteriota bacterium]
MSVVLSIEDLGPSQKQLTIEVPQPAVEAEIGRVVQEYGRRVNLPGFRKGKVPAILIRKRFADEVQREVLDRLIPRYWHQAQAEKGLEPLLAPDITDLTYESGKPMTFVASVDVRPPIALGDLDSFDLPEINAEIEDHEIDDFVEQMQRQHGELQPVERAAEGGDYARVTRVALTESGEGDPQTFQVELGDERYGEEISDAVIGLSAGESEEYSQTVTVESTDEVDTTEVAADDAGADSDDENDGDESDGDGDGDEKTVELRYRVTLDEVRAMALPEVDDAFASRFGLADVDALHTQVREHLTEEKTREQKRDRERTLLEQLRERHPVELPRRVVEHENESLVRDYLSNLEQRG